VVQAVRRRLLVPLERVYQGRAMTAQLPVQHLVLLVAAVVQARWVLTSLQQWAAMVETELQIPIQVHQLHTQVAAVAVPTTMPLAAEQVERAAAATAVLHLQTLAQSVRREQSTLAAVAAVAAAALLAVHLVQQAVQELSFFVIQTRCQISQQLVELWFTQKRQMAVLRFTHLRQEQGR
jgi:hypothetical protein